MKTYTWDEAVQYANNLRLAGCDDWRLPSFKELQSLANSGQTNYNYIGCYWLSTASANYPYYAWYVNFNIGYVYYYLKGGRFYVRTVRGGQFDYLGDLIIKEFDVVQGRYIDNMDGTIIDNLTGLIWEKL